MSVLHKLTKEEIKSIQQRLNALVVPSPKLVDDGIWGNKTTSALKLFQKQNNLVDDGIWGPITEGHLYPIFQDFSFENFHESGNKKLTEKDIADVAKHIGCEVAALKAVMEVEAKGSGFLPSGKPVILFERHIFYRYYARKYSTQKADELALKEPNICNKATGGYVGLEKEYPRLDKAIAIDKEVAYMSASWGLGQVMGFNYQMAGYKDVFSFVDAMEVSEYNQLMAMASFILASSKLTKAIKAKDWASFAEGYNGKNYKINKYDEKLAKAYDKYK